MEGSGGLTIETLERCVLVPCARADSGTFVGGAFTSEGAKVEGALLSRTVGDVVSPPPVMPLALTSLKGDFLFGGYIFGHFGHFLLESCSRLWATESGSDLRVLWLLAEGFFHPFQKAVLRILGVRNEHLFLTVPTEIERLHIPAPAYRVQDWCHPRMVEFMGRHKGELEPKEKLWISRSALPDSLAHIEGEIEIEEALRKRGWRIWHPQTCPLTEQLSVLGSAGHISGFAGSAFHSLLLMESVSAKITMFNRGGYRNKNYDTVAAAKCIDQRVIFIDMQEGERRGHRTSYKLTDVSTVLDFLV